MSAAVIETIVDRLASASIAIALLAVAAWLLCRLRPTLAASTRTTIWWLVAVAALLRLAPIPALTLEVPDALRLGALLPTAPAASSPVESTTGVSAGAASPADRVLSRVPARVAARVPARVAERLINPFVPMAAPQTTAAAVADTPFDWRIPLVALWAVVVCALFVRLAIAHWRLRRLADDAEPMPDAIAADVDRLAAGLSLRRTPAVRVSDQIESPLVFGLLRPTVLLPDTTLTLTPRERAMTLCHELAHVRRLDLAFAWAPAVMERLLFFHPGARLAAREYAFAREAACDADVLQHLDEAPRDYGRLLVRLGVTRRPAALAAAQSSPSTRMLRRRLALLNDHEPSQPGRGSWLAAALLLPLALPLSLVAGQRDLPPPPPPAPPAPATAAPPAPPPAPPAVAKSASVHLPPVPPAAPPAAPLAAPPANAVPDDQAPPPPPPPPPRPAGDKAPPPPPPPPPPPAASAFYWSDAGDGTFALFDRDGTSVFAGTSKEAIEARRLRGSDSGPFLYYRSNGKAYTSRDPVLIEKIRAEMQEQRELGRRQAELGHLQGELGAQQAALLTGNAHTGTRRATTGSTTAGPGHPARVSALESALATLEAERGVKSAELDAAMQALRKAIETLRQGVATNTADIERQTAALHAEAEAKAVQQDVAAQHEALGQRQANLGREQAELGRQQKAAADAARQRIMRILQEAEAAGQAQPVK